MTTSLSFADVDAGVRATIATYCQALDDGRTDDVVATFCADGSISIPGLGTHVGTDALRTAYAGWAPRRPQRHLVLNTRITAWGDDEATAVSDLVFVLMGPQGWDVQMVGRYNDVLHRAGDRWRFHRRTATFETGGTDHE